MSEKKYVCIYHGGCTDGVAAAWALWSSPANKDDRWVFHPGVYQENPPLKLVEGAEVCFVDFSYKRPVMQHILDVAESVSILDHHASAYEDLKSIADRFDVFDFDMNQCGAMMSYRFWHDRSLEPELLRYIDHRDRFDFENAPADLDAVTMALRSYSHAPADGSKMAWELLMQVWGHLMSPLGLKHLRKEGPAILRYYRQRVEEYVGGARTWSFFDGDGREFVGEFTNCPHSFASDVGHELAGIPLGTKLGGCYWHNSDDTVTFSLRSTNDVARHVAEMYGGGGHPNAAGFKVPVTQVDFSNAYVHPRR